MHFNFIKFTLILGVVFSSQSFSQVKIAELLQKSDYHTETSKKKLFMIEFWTTWCGPCITVSDYLDILQEQYKNDLYILSISEESSDIVKKFLIKRPTRFATAIDYDGVTFKKYGVKDLPFAVILDINAKVVWKGNPANLSNYDLDRFLRKSSNRFDVNQMIDIEAYELVSDSPPILNGTYKISEFPTDFSPGITVFRNSNYMKIEGSLKYILGYLLKSSPKQIQIEISDNKMYILEVQYQENLESVSKKILKVLGLTLTKTTKKVNALELSCSACKDQFWTENQIDWGTDSPQFLVDDIQFSADNSSLDDFVFKLSSLTGIPVVAKSDLEDEFQLFDWQLHYKFYDLMVDDLLFNYGIAVEKVQREISFYSVVK
jgi:thiol-disulfide isomerase/thioredoxin